MAKARKVKVKFLLSPSGRFNLAYSAGDEGEFEEKQAQELVESGYAEYTDKADAKADEGEVADPFKVLRDENASLKEKNDQYLKELEALKAANPNPHGNGNLPIGATSGDLQTTLGVEEAKAAVTAPVDATPDANLAATGTTGAEGTANPATTGTVTDATNAQGNAEGAAAAKTTTAGTTTDGDTGGVPTKVTKGNTGK